jgi:DNA-binding MarR family transcriptional regulator
VNKQDHIDRVVAQWRQERPDIDLSPVEIIGRAGRIMSYVDRALESKFGEFGISRADWDVLAALRRNGPPYKMTQHDLMRNLLRTSGSMSLRIDALERAALVKREQDPDDRRSSLVVLSLKGAKILDTVIPHHLENESSLLDGLSAPDRVQLISLLRKWLLSLEDKGSGGRHLPLGLVVLDPRASLMKRRAVGLPDVPGLLVHFVEPGSQAGAAGFRKGDLIALIGDAQVRSIVELREALHEEEQRIVVVRGFERVILQVRDPDKKRSLPKRTRK